MQEEQPIRQTCVEATCRKPFEIEAGEKAYFEQMGLSQPRRCKACRAKRKAAAQAAAEAEGQR